MNIINILKTKRNYTVYEETETGAEVRRIGVCTFEEVWGIIRFIGVPLGYKRDKLNELFAENDFIFIYINIDGSHARCIKKVKDYKLW